MFTAIPHRRQAFRLVSAAAIALAFLLAVLPAVLAASPQRLAGPITDDVGALGGNTSGVQATLDDLQRATGVQLWVWYTDTLGGMAPGDFATKTADASDLGTTDLLLVIALDDRAYGYWKGDNVGILNADLDQVLAQDMEPALRSADYPGAITATADGLGKALNGTPDGATDGSLVGSVLTVLLGVGLVAAGGWFVLSTWSRRRIRAGEGAGAAGAGASGNVPAGPNADLAAMEPDQLDELANRILVETDDAIRDSDQELGFAQAQFGDEAAAPFIAAIAAAREDLRGAFTIRQQLDDATPEDGPTRRRMLTDLIVACRTAQDRLRAETQRFEELRALEKAAPDILAKLPARADQLEARLPAAEATLARLTEYADTDWQAVAGNVDNARTRIAAVREAADQGTKALAAGAPGAAGVAARAARLGEDGLAQGVAFLDAIDRLASELDEARAKVGTELTAAEGDLAKAQASAAEASTAGTPADADVTRRLAEAAQLLTEARTALDPPKPDVTGAYEKVRRADELADAVEQGLRTAREQQAREAARLDAGLRAARMAVTRASDYVGGQRGGIGTQARTRLAEATRRLEQATALASTDPAGALAEADRATRLAAEAQRLAEQDYGAWNDPFRGGMGGGGGHRGRGGRRGGGHRGGGGIDGSDIAGAIIGGIIGGMLSGGGHRGGGGFGGFGGGGGGFGGFGGSSGGGSFGGGGGSSGGGRW